MYFSAGNTTASRVYWQGGNFTTNTYNKGVGAVSADTLYYPSGVTLDNSGGLYVVDSSNHRVLYFAAGNTTASRVYGQGENNLPPTLPIREVSVPIL